MIVSSSRRPRAREGSSSSRGSPPGPSSTRPRRCTGASAATRPPRLDEPVRLPVLDRYLARELVSPFAFACALLTFFLVIDRIYHLTDLVITKGVPLHLVLELLAFMLPLFVAYTLPMALLVAVLLAGGRLASDLEIVAFKAAGVSALRLFRPVLAASVLIAGATAVLTLVVNPAASAEFQRQLFRILQARALSGLQERVFNTTFGELTIYVEDVSASQVALRGILVSDERDPTLSRIISSREGRLLTDEVNRSITLRMIDGAVNEADILPVDLPKEVATKDSSPTTGGAASAAAIWARNALFGVVGLGLLIATAREWRWPAMPAVWRTLAAVRRAVPVERLRWRRQGARGPRDSTHIIDRYLVREYLTFMGIGLAVAAALFVVIDLVQTLDKYLRVKPPVMYILEHFAYRLPAALHDGLPVVMLVATIFLFLTLSRYHELTALKAAGVSLYRVSAPVLGVGLVVAIGAGLFQELALPVLNERGDEVDRVKIRGQAPRHLQSRQRLWVRSADTRFYRVELLNPGTNDLYGVTILELDREFRLTGRLDARRAHWTAGGWEMSEGAYREVEADGKVQTVPFGWTALDLKEELEDFLRIQKPVSTMSFWELRDYIGQLEAAGFQIRKYLVELYSKLSFPLVNLVMVLVAIPFALQSPRGGRLVGIGLAIVIMAGYLVVHYVALAFARADLLPPLIAAWTANVIFVGIGVSLMLRART